MFDENVQIYLKSNIKAIGAIAVIVGYDAEIDIEVRLKLVEVVISSERNLLDFIEDFSISERDEFTVNSSLKKLININKELVICIEKLQSKGYKLDKVITALKLENQSIKSILFNVSE